MIVQQTGKGGKGQENRLDITLGFWQPVYMKEIFDNCNETNNDQYSFFNGNWSKDQLYIKINFRQVTNSKADSSGFADVEDAELTDSEDLEYFSDSEIEAQIRKKLPIPYHQTKE